MSSLTAEEIFCAAELACQAGDLPRMSKLLEHWTSPTTGFPFNYSISQAQLDFAISNGHTFLITNLLERGTELTWSTTRNAAQRGSIDVFQILLDHGWDINSRPECTSLRLAISHNHPELVRWHLSHGADPDLHTGDKIDALAIAAARNSLSMVQCLIEYGASIRGTKALLAAAGLKDKTPETIMIIRLLVDIGVDVNYVEEPREKLIYESWFRGTALHYAVEIQDEERVMLLLELGADPSVKGTAGFTLLEAAKLSAEEFGGFDIIMKILQEHGEFQSPGRSLLGTVQI